MKVTKGFYGKSKKSNLQIEESTKNTQIQNLRAGKYHQMSKSLSLTSNYSGITSLFWVGSRQSSLKTDDDVVSHGRVGTRVSQEESFECSSNLQEEPKSYLYLRRADAIDEVSPSLERWNPPDVIVHRPEESPSLSGKE